MTAIQQQRLIGAILVALLVAVLAWFVLTGVDSQEQVTATTDDDAIVFEPAVEPVGDESTIAPSDDDQTQAAADETVTLPQQEEARVVVSEQTTDATSAEEELSEPNDTATQDDTTSDELTLLAEKLNAESAGESVSSNQTSSPNSEVSNGSQEDESADPTPHWVLQLGSFSKRDNAQSLEGKLRSSGYEPVVEEAQIDGRTIYRVRLQADHDRERLEQLAANIADEMGITPQLMPHTP